MKLSELEPIILEMLCAWQFFRNIGYASEQLFVGRDVENVFVQAQWRGMEFNLICGHDAMSNERLAAAWIEAADALSEASEEEFDVAWRASKAFELKTYILVALSEKGMHWPNCEKFRHLN